jgi:hypothetical protein
MAGRIFKKRYSLKDRANIALSATNKNSYAMTMLRNRIETKIAVISDRVEGDSDQYLRLTRMLDLVKSGQMLLDDISEHIEYGKFLEEFISIMYNALNSLYDIKPGLEGIVPQAERTLQEMKEIISSMCMTLDLPEKVDVSVNFAEQDRSTEALSINSEISLLQKHSSRPEKIIDIKNLEYSND